MSQFPYLVEIQEPLETIHIPPGVANLNLQMNSNPSFTTTENPQIFVNTEDNPIQILQETAEGVQQNFGILTTNPDQSCVFQIVYPQEFSLSRTAVKRGRPRKKLKTQLVTENAELLSEKVETSPPKRARTRSGRLVRPPKSLEKDFKKIEITSKEQEPTTDLQQQFEEKENSKVEFAGLQKRTRNVAAQFRCPKCSKAYLGKNKMIAHLKKNPDHGPLSESFQEYNFDVWNYLFDITQKSKPRQRGLKFCEELSNLLHNVQLLKSALFKTVTDNKNTVQIDKVLGNAIGLTPGKYKFDENELYKDVTVLQLITNSDFFKPNANKNGDREKVNGDAVESKESTIDSSCGEVAQNEPLISSDNLTNDILDNGIKTCNETYDKLPEALMLKSQSSLEYREEAARENNEKKIDEENRISLHNDLLGDNLLLPSLPHPRNSMDELMLSGVDHSSNLLDTSTSSDEVMNVDQFVNERFKKIIEPDMELGSSSLSLDLMPSLELFQFHTT